MSTMTRQEAIDFLRNNGTACLLATGTEGAGRKFLECAALLADDVEADSEENIYRALRRAHLAGGDTVKVKTGTYNFSGPLLLAPRSPPPKQRPKVVQVIHVRAIQGRRNAAIVTLLDDGTIWERDVSGGEWMPLSLPPPCTGDE